MRPPDVKGGPPDQRATFNAQPHATTAKGSVTSVTPAGDSDTIGVQLRRRREASWRLPPLEDGTGRRDPLDPKPGRRAPVQILSITTDSVAGVALLRGRNCRKLIQDLALTATWSESGRGWVVDAVHVPDLIALGEIRHFVVTERERAA